MISELIQKIENSGDNNYEYIIQSNNKQRVDFQFVVCGNPSLAQYNCSILAKLNNEENYIDKTVEFYGAPKNGQLEHFNMILRDEQNLTKTYESFKIKIEIIGANDDFCFSLYYFKIQYL